MNHNVPEKSSVGGTVVSDSQHLSLEIYDDAYSIGIHTQGHTTMVCSNPIYSTVTESRRQVLPQDEYVNVDGGQEELVVTSKNPAYATSLMEAAGYK